MEMYTFLLSMTSDENRVLTSYSRKKITQSDHYLLITKSNFPWNDKAMLKLQRCRRAKTVQGDDF